MSNNTLSARQLETLIDLKKHHQMTQPSEVIAWCQHKLTLPYYRGTRHQNIPTRKRSKQYYQDIIDYLSVDTSCDGGQIIA